MKANQILALAGISMLAMSNSCEKQNDAAPCEESQVAAQTPAFSLICSLNARTGESKTYVINSSAELTSATLCGNNSLPLIDFKLYTLLAGRAAMPTGAVLQSQSVTKECSGNYKYTINIAEGVLEKPTDVDYSILVPKLANGANVNFTVNRVK